MVKYLFILLIFIGLFCTGTFCFAESGKVLCKSGDCDRWEASYDRYGDNIKFDIRNISGKPLFKIKATIHYYNYLGEYLGQHFIYLEGPIHKYIIQQFKITRDTFSMDFDINCTDEYEGKQPRTNISE